MSQTKYWWQDRAWRIVQTNMREIDMADMSAEQYVKDLQSFNANTVIINTGGIIANYDTKVPVHFRNEHLKADSLKEVIAACHEAGIRVISRVDFSKVRRPIYENHPDWAYVSPKGSIIDYHGNIHMCFNSEYQQKYAMDIIREIITDVNPDGIFMNMGGYFAAYDYTNGWQGICQCENCRRLYREMYGEDLPTVENHDDPHYQRYMEFQRRTEKQYYDNINRIIAETKPELLFFHTNMLRGEIGTWIQNNNQNYLYKGSELLKVEKYSNPEKVSSATSVDFIDMLYRFASVSPFQQELRLAQTMANGGFADLYMVGKISNHPNRSGFEPLRRMFQYHKDHEDDYYSALSVCDIALIKPFKSFFDNFKANPDEYFGWYQMLTQQHYLFDCIESNALEKVALDKYKTIILADVQNLSDAASAKLDGFVRAGGTLIATGESALYTPRREKRTNISLASLGVNRVGYTGRGMLSAYFLLEDKKLFPRFADTDFVYLHDVYCYADYAEGVEKHMKLIPPHRHSPAEEAYHTSITEYPAFTVNRYGEGCGVYVPWKAGDEYYRLGFADMGNFMADLMENVLGLRAAGGNLPPMVELSHTVREQTGVHYVHLVNDTGFFCNSYFKPLTLDNLVVELPWQGPAPKAAVSLPNGAPVRFEASEDTLTLRIDRLELFEAVKLTF